MYLSKMSIICTLLYEFLRDLDSQRDFNKKLSQNSWSTRTILSLKVCSNKIQSRNLIHHNRPLVNDVAEASAVQPADIQTQS